MILNFKKIGDSGQPLVVLHGVFGFLDNWLTISKSIADQGYILYLVDQRNHGRSPHQEPMDYPTFSADLREFLEQQNLKNPHLLGHSMGGKTVMQYAADYPGTFNKLVVVDIGPKAYPINHTNILKGLNAIPIDEISSRNEADEVLAQYEPIPPVRQFLLKNLYRKDEGGFGWRFNLPVLTSSMPKVGVATQYHAPINNPTLFIRGEKSDYIQDDDWEDIRKIFPNAELETIANAGHWIHAEQPQAFTKCLVAFLKKV
ncbi:alpha/beta fold hydrolase [Dyadobacter sp. 32]|uniref:alpha/beta fold hydrolase n=1 Tax=Dyadobacter sp. 32 TaxID=538966 RepID=UPI0011EC8809